MPGLEKGTVCIKTKGRDAGKKAVIVDFDKKTGFAVIEGKGVKRRKCNPMHLFPLPQKKGVKKGKAKAKKSSAGK